MYQNSVTKLYKNIKKNNYGFGFMFFKNLNSRIEFYQKNSVDLNPLQKFLTDAFINIFKVNKHSYKIKQLINIYMLNLLGTYKGWRHSRGLPVRGQRTWSNGWSSYRSNLTLRSYKIILAKKMYGQNFSNDCFVAYIAEEVNNMWRLQWGKEWLIAKKKRLNSMKNIKKNEKIDLVSISKLQIGPIGKTNEGKQKNKKIKNTYTIGFDPGFTKLYLQKTANQNKAKK